MKKRKKTMIKTAVIKKLNPGNWLNSLEAYYNVYIHFPYFETLVFQKATKDSRNGIYFRKKRKFFIWKKWQSLKLLENQKKTVFDSFIHSESGCQSRNSCKTVFQLPLMNICSINVYHIECASLFICILFIKYLNVICFHFFLIKCVWYIIKRYHI